ncbi:hypothetical protein [Pontibacter oryzae]|uniref:Uncharacterized protein n=1 Tax=Pontibacter oryzae TaxID=2304593 RepID=A0A399SEE8_9BACT|nr:hypothetical protein [Pontibacter oryzae]RIJ42466.1 hypothetical protein D1627_00935 [Pontibacter oryzae]
MKTNWIRVFLLYLLAFTATFTFLKLWDYWECLLLGKPTDLAAALTAIDFSQIYAIALPVSLMLGMSKYKKLTKSARG